jgi:pimeloyl-ACP methyl ester carboxylesterase
VVLALAFVLAIAYAGICLYAAATLSTTGTHKPLTASAGSIGVNWEDVTFASRLDQIMLRGWLFHASARDGRSAILLHGFTANRTDPGFDEPAMARAFIAAGYDTLVFDFRSFGLSDGNGFTIGWKEGRDVLGAYDFMKSRGFDPHLMAVLGVSMGGESMLGAAEQLGDVGALVADSAYANLRPILDLDITRYSGLPGFFNPGIIAAGQLFYGLNPDFRPVDHVRDSPQRAFLFLVGATDTFIPTANAYELKAASRNPNTRLVVFEGSAHAKEFHDHESLYLSTVFGFIDQQIAAPRT